MAKSKCAKRGHKWERLGRELDVCQRKDCRTMQVDLSGVPKGPIRNPDFPVYDHDVDGWQVHLEPAVDVAYVYSPQRLPYIVSLSRAAKFMAAALMGQG